MFFSFPRMVGLPNQFMVYSMEELENIIRFNNGKKSIYIRLYRNPQEIDKIFLDIDGLDKIHVPRKIHEWCKKNNYRHGVLISGTGYHVHIKTKVSKLKNPKVALANLFDYIAKECNLKVTMDKDSDLDPHIRGDVSRICRLPYTINTKNGAWCCFLTEELLNSESDVILDYAKNPKKDFIFFGEKDIDLTEFDGETYKEISYDLKLDPTLKIDEDYLPQCIKNILRDEGFRNSRGRHKQRYELIIYLRDMGESQIAVTELLRKYLSPDRFRHCIEEERQVEYLFGKNDYFFVHDRLRDWGYCKDENCGIKEIYKKW